MARPPGGWLMPGKPLILLVGNNRANLNLLSQQMRKEGYEPVSVTSLEEFDKVLSEQPKPSLSLMDLSGFDQRIWARCEQLRKERVPFILISPQRSPTVQRDSMKYGASGLLVKPVGVQALVEYVHTLLGD